MIKSIQIKNFQSHKDTYIEFGDGLNVLTGSSRSGKSTVRRALMWCMLNRPTGNSIISWWNKKKDKPTGETSVTVTLDNGTVITRIKSPELNGYIINGKTLEAVGTNVPEEITEAFNISDVNYSGQFDAPYLVSQSAGYVAQYLNAIVNLEDADYYQKEVESLKRSCQREIDTDTENATKYRVSLTWYDWLGSAEKTIEFIKDKSSTLSNTETVLLNIKRVYEEREKAKKTHSDLEEVVPVANELIKSIGQNIESVRQIKSKISRIQELCSARNDALEHMNVPVSDMESTIKKIERLNRALTMCQNDTVSIKKKKTEYDEAVGIFVTTNREIKDAERELNLVDICPLCGNKRKDTKVVF